MASKYGKCPKCGDGELVKSITNFKVLEEGSKAKHTERIKCNKCDYVEMIARPETELTERELKNLSK